jgi:hypothetical protein
MRSRNHNMLAKMELEARLDAAARLMSTPAVTAPETTY